MSETLTGKVISINVDLIEAAGLLAVKATVEFENIRASSVVPTFGSGTIVELVKEAEEKAIHQAISDAQTKAFILGVVQSRDGSPLAQLRRIEQRFYEEGNTDESGEAVTNG